MQIIDLVKNPIIYKDAIALKHDICYRDNNNKQGKLKCDKDMLNSLSKNKTKGARELFDKKTCTSSNRNKI